MGLTVADLVEYLDCLDSDTEVNIAVQPTYPMYGKADNITLVDFCGCQDCDEGEESDCPQRKRVLMLCAADADEYADRAWWNA